MGTLVAYALPVLGLIVRFVAVAMTAAFVERRPGKRFGLGLSITLLCFVPALACLGAFELARGQSVVASLVLPSIVLLLDVLAIFVMVGARGSKPLFVVLMGAFCADVVFLAMILYTVKH